MEFEIQQSEVLRFYAFLQLAVVAWAALSLALGGMLGLPVAPLGILTMGGILGILKLAMRTRTYSRIKQRLDS